MRTQSTTLAFRKMKAIPAYPLRAKFSRAAAVLAFLVLGTATAADARSVTYDLDIPAQDLNDSLHALAIASQHKLLYSSELVDGKSAPAVKGTYTAEQAVRQLLAGTHLVYEISDGLVLIRSADDQQPLPAADGTNVDPPRATAGRGALRRGERRGAFRLARAQGEENKRSSGAEARENSSERERSEERKAELEEIVVTAARRAQDSSDVPGGVQAFSGKELELRGVGSMQNYIVQVPGVSFRDQGNGAKRIALRGISNATGSDTGTTATSSTVGLYLNDIPIQGTSVLPDLDLYDLERVEVLKGPQGSLYGEGAMSGAIKMIVASPVFAETMVKSEATVSGTHHGGTNYRVRSAANLPLIHDTLAIRLVGSKKEDSGFITNSLSGEQHINTSDAYSLRGALKGQLTDDLAAEAMVMRDRSNLDEFAQYNENLGAFLLDVPEDRYSRKEFTAYALTLNYDLGFANLTSSSSYYTNNNGLAESVALVAATFARVSPITQQVVHTQIDLRSFAEEVRLVSQGDSPLEWILGGFYRTRTIDTRTEFPIAAVDLAPLNAALTAAGSVPVPADGVPFRNTVEDGYDQLAFYGDLSYAVTDRLKLSASLRWSNEKTSVAREFFGYSLLAGATTPLNTVDSEGSAVLPKVSVAYELADKKMVYALASKGYRAPTINVTSSLGAGKPVAAPDFIWNYEIGTKTSWLDNRLKANLSGYYIEWSRIQSNLSTFQPALGTRIGYLDNGGDATVRGAELEVIAAAGNLSMGFTFGYNESEMVTSIAGTGIATGVPLPNAPRWTASEFIQYQVPFMEGDVFLRADASQTDSQYTRFILDNVMPESIEGYAMANLRIGYARNRWNVALFADNAFDERAQLGRGFSAVSFARNPERIALARPRTIGLTFGFQL